MTVSTQQQKANHFRLLHTAADGFVIPNPWDVGSARMLEALGFKALATTSAGFAFSRGRIDGSVPRQVLLEHLADIAASTDLPVSADLENGYGDSPDEVAQTIRLAAASGVIGGSIEDSRDNAADPLYAREFAAERIRAAVEAARSLPFHFTLTARAENFAVGRPDLSDTIARLQAYQEAGADVLFAPWLTRQEDIATLVRSVDRPVSIMMGPPGMNLSVHELTQLGVRRISVGATLARAAYGEFLRAAKELRDVGTTNYRDSAVSGQELGAMFQRDAQLA